MFDAGGCEAVSFGCYGRLIDWESGIISGLRPVLANHGINVTDDEVLELHVEVEHRLQSSSTEGNYTKHRALLGQEVLEAGKRWGFEPELSEVDAFADALIVWRSFPDTVEALKDLKKRYTLAIISNVDDGLLALTACHLEVEFDWIITDEQGDTYKASTNNFEVAIGRIGLGREKLLHAAESLFHDVRPVRELGVSTVWVHRRIGRLRSDPAGQCQARAQRSRPEDPGRRGWRVMRDRRRYP